MAYDRSDVVGPVCREEGGQVAQLAPRRTQFEHPPEVDFDRSRRAIGDRVERSEYASHPCRLDVGCPRVGVADQRVRVQEGPVHAATMVDRLCGQERIGAWILQESFG